MIIRSGTVHDTEPHIALSWLTHPTVGIEASPHSLRRLDDWEKLGS